MTATWPVVTSSEEDPPPSVKVTPPKPSSEGNDIIGFTAKRPVERSWLESFKLAMYDSSEGSILGRTPLSWAKIIGFYLVFYTCLGVFAFGGFQLYMLTIDLEAPKYTLGGSPIGTNPGVAIRPLHASEQVAVSMIELVAKASLGGEEPSEDFDTESNVDWAKRYELFLKSYDDTTDTRVCSEEDEGSSSEEKACRFDPKAMLGPCAEYPYGYEVSGNETLVSPCVLLKVNKIYDWIPSPYTSEEIDHLELPSKVRELAKVNPDQLYLNCEGQTASDRETLSEATVDYYPSEQGIPFHYFPYHHARRRYQSPLVAVRFGSLPMGRLVHVECKLFTKGVEHDRRRGGGGMVRFQIMLKE